MKKALVILTAMLFLVVTVGAAYAAETTFNGQYRVRAFRNWNFDKQPGHLNSEKGLYTGYFDQRFRLTITHTRSEFLKAVVQIDLVEDTWGQQRNFRINNSTNGSLVRKAYIEFNVPKLGTFTVGKQPVTFGYGLVFSDSLGKLDGIKWANKWGPVAVSAMYFKWHDRIDEGGSSLLYNRDNDIWALDLKYTPNANHTIELFGGYANYRAGYSLGHGWTAADVSHANLGFAGIAYTGEIADMLTLKAEFSGIFGREDWTKDGGVDDAFNGGYNIYLDASYHNDMLRAGLAFVLGSGNKRQDQNDEIWNGNFITADAFSFGNIIAGGLGSGGLNDTWVTGLGFSNDIENLTAIKAYIEIHPTEKLTLNAAVIWAKWTEPVGATRVYGHPMNYYNPATTYTPWYNGSMDLGWEVDLGTSYKIMDGLTLSLSAGVLFPGDSFDYVGDGGTHEEWGPIWMMNNTLTYEF
jgi:hypothetical protein